jgi:hypothetical protein
VALEGQFCSANPNTVGFPYKILFVVDVSGSTTTSDPTGGRAPAVQQVINQYLPTPEVSFALLAFSTDPIPVEPLFTRDPAVLQGVVPQLNQSMGSTNYLSTLQAALNIITQDANQMTVAERARTRYDIQWLSDGVPNPCTQIPGVPDAEKQILNLVQSQGLFGITLSTIFLTGDPAANTTCPQTANQVLSDMATEGGGTFQALAGNQIKFNINFTRIVTPFQQHMFYLVNESRVVKNNVAYADSDSDGVSDNDEVAAGTDPLQADPNHTGCTDRINALLQPNVGLCPGTCNRDLQAVSGNVAALGDKDVDGLHDCEEQALGANSHRADSDGDNFIDALEARFGTNFNDPGTPTVDTDRDGTPDGEEIITGTDPLSAEPNRDLAYVYQPLSAAAATVAGTTCANFNVSNVQLVETRATATTAAGDNRLCLYIEQLPQNVSSASSEPTVTKTCSVANYHHQNGAEFKNPAGGIIRINPADFKPTICASAACMPQ